MLLGDSRNDFLRFAAIHLVVFLGVFAVLSYLFYSHTVLEHYFAGLMLDGNIPYHDFTSEYPPLALLSYILPGILFRDANLYVWAFATEMLVFNLLIMLMLTSLARFLKLSVLRTLVTYTVLVLAVGAILASRYDILPAMLTLAGLYALIKNRPNLAWAVMALAVMAKLYPVIIVPLFAIYHFRKKQYRDMVTGPLVFLGVVLLVSLPFLLIDAPGYWASYSFHLDRPLHSESTYGTVLLVGKLLGLVSFTGDLTYGSWNLFSPLADSLAGSAFYILAACLLLIYGLFWWRLGKGQSTGLKTTSITVPDTMLLIRCTTLVIIIFLLANKVFSVQYLVWLLPLFPLVTGKWRDMLAGLFLVAALITQFIYPYNYIAFAGGEALPVVLMAFRNLLLIGTMVLLLWPFEGENMRSGLLDSEKVSESITPSGRN